jgi:UTP--glucose-1-phosphate uridylyltransferase
VGSVLGPMDPLNPANPKDLLRDLGLKHTLSAAELAMLQRHGFDATAFAYLQAELAAGRFSTERNRVEGTVQKTLPEDLLAWPATGSPDAAKLQRLGQAALDAGEVGVAILNGGMATRFGGRVKGVVEVDGGLSFLALKLRDIAAHTQVPVFIMNSFATDADTRKHFAQHHNFGIAADRLHFVSQSISLRLQPSGAVYRDAAKEVSYYAPGHGDLLQALRTSEAFTQFAQSGGKMVCISNVDNLGATLEPKVIGAHLQAGLPMTTEVASREGGDTGGAPVRRGNKVEVLEGFRFPRGFDTEQLAAFNTNTFVVSTAAIAKEYPLTWFRADKKVGNDSVVQFERLLGELTAFVPSSYLLVPRQGPEGRFLPVKTPQDIEQVRPAVRLRFGL